MAAPLTWQKLTNHALKLADINLCCVLRQVPRHSGAKASQDRRHSPKSLAKVPKPRGCDYSRAVCWYVAWQ
jgi:hypothetical protein